MFITLNPNNNPNQAQVEANQQVLQNLIQDGFTISQPTVSAAASLAISTFRPTYDINALWIDQATKDEINAQLLALDVELTRLINLFKSSQYNHFRVTEFKNLVNQQVDLVKAAWTGAPVSPSSDAATWATNFVAAIKSAVAGLKGITTITHPEVFTLWENDIAQVINTMNNQFIADCKFAEYGIDRNHYDASPTANSAFDALQLGLLRFITTVAGSQTPSWNDIVQLNPRLDSTQIAKIEAELNTYVKERFDNAFIKSGNMDENLHALSKSEFDLFKQSIDAYGHIGNTPELIATINKLFTGTADFASFVNTYNNPSNPNAKYSLRFSLGNNDISRDIVLVEFKVELVPSDQALPTFSQSVPIRVNNQSRAKEAFNAINGFNGQIKIDPQSTWNGISTIDSANPPGTITLPGQNNLGQFPWDTSAIWMGTHQPLNSLTQIVNKFSDIKGTFTWRIVNENGNWFLVADIPDGSDVLHARIPLVVFTPLEKIKEYLKTSPFAGTKIYRSEFDDTQAIEDRILTQQIIDHIKSIIGGTDQEVKDMFTIEMRTTSRGQVPYAIFTLSDGTKKEFALEVSQYDSPSAEVGVLIPRQENDPHGVETAPDSGIFEPFEVGDTLTEEQLKENFPTIMSEKGLMDRFSIFDLKITCDGVVTAGPNGIPVVTFVIEDETIDSSITVSRPVNHMIVDQPLIDAAIAKVNHEAELIRDSIDQYDGPNADQVKADANSKLDAIMNNFSQFTAPLQAMLGKPVQRLGVSTQGLINALDAILKGQITLPDNTTFDYEITKKEELQIPKDMTQASKILMMVSASLSGLGGLVALGNAATIATTNKKLKKNGSTMKVKSVKTGLLSLGVAVLLVGISVGMFVYLFVEQGGL